MNGHSSHPRLGQAVELLRSLIAIPSPSREEEKTADVWQQWLLCHHKGEVRRLHNNVYALPRHFDPSLPTVMLNSHHDTVRPAPSYTRSPFSPDIEGDRLYGLGSNDAGASGVTLAATFLDMESRTPGFNLLLAITAAEEVMGELGMRAFLPHLAEEGLTPDMVIVGEPTGMQAAAAERGLVVLDCVALGKAGHAAREEGINALYRAIDDINRLRNFREDNPSAILGPLKISVTMIEAGRQHNVVPDSCRYVVDVRTTEAMSNAETVDALRRCVEWSELTPRSTRVWPSVLPADHPLAKAAAKMGKKLFVSPTTSDMALLHGIPSLKMGPGDSARSHTADEFVLLSEINEALFEYPRFLESLGFCL